MDSGSTDQVVNVCCAPQDADGDLSRLDGATS